MFHNQMGMSMTQCEDGSEILDNVFSVSQLLDKTNTEPYLIILSTLCGIRLNASVNEMHSENMYVN